MKKIHLDVTLTWYELHMAAQVGLLRRLASLRRGRSNAHGYDDSDPWTVDIEAACAEAAAAKLLGLYWGGSVDTFKGQGDVGSLEVRWTSRQNGCLIVRPGDHDDASYLLMVGKAPQYRAAGWIIASEAKQEKWAKGPNGRPDAYFVPQGELTPLKPSR